MNYLVKEKKIWFDIGTPFNCNLVHAIIQNLGDEINYFITCRDHDANIAILESKGLDFTCVGHHGGKTLKGKLTAYAKRILELADIISKEKPDLLITERSPSAVRTAFGFSIPSWTVFYDEREHWTNWMVFPISTEIYVPKFYTIEELTKYGVDPSKIVWFNGFHAAFLKNTHFSEQENNPIDSPNQKILIRPELEFATFFDTDRKPILEDVVEILSKQIPDVDIIVFPRNKKQKAVFEKYPVKIIEGSLSSCPVASVDLIIGAAETMLMEALVLLKPSISCIYWNPSRPVEYLLKYIEYSTEPHEIVKLAEKYLDPVYASSWREKVRNVVEEMDDLSILIANRAKKFLLGY